MNLRGRQAGAQGGPLQSDSLAAKQQHSSGPDDPLQNIFQQNQQGLGDAAGYHLTDV